jgi:hypothetical protein
MEYKYNTLNLNTLQPYKAQRQPELFICKLISVLWIYEQSKINKNVSTF